MAISCLSSSDARSSSVGVVVLSLWTAASTPGGDAELCTAALGVLARDTAENASAVSVEGSNAGEAGHDGHGGENC